MKGSDFIFEGVNLLYYKYHKINFICGGSYLESPDWRKKSNNNSEKKKINIFNTQQQLH